MVSETLRHEGGCLCGKVRYACQGPPKWVVHCHCASCRRASGGVVVTWAGFLAERFTITRGAPVRFASSPGVARSFCGDCGSPLTYEAERFPGEVHVTVATLDRPEDFAPSRHVYSRERVPWLQIDPHLAGYE